MSTVGFSTLDVIPSVKGLRANLERQTSGDFAAAGRKGGQQFGDAAGKEAGSRFSKGFGGATKGLLAPLAAGVAGAGLFQAFNDIKDRASAAEQAVGGVRAVFGEYADGVIKDAGRADQALGLSTTAYEELITLSAALLKNKGLKDFANQASGLVKIGADLAAQFGGSTQQAVEALNSALRGESDPIERYAISLNEAAVQSVLAANGQQKLKGAALEQAKTMARLQLIVQQSADSSGAFARESDTAAGSAARASAQWANMRTELGDKLLPTYTKFTSFLNDEGLPALESVGGVAADAVRGFASLPGPVKAAAAALVTFRLAQASGLTTALASGASSATSGLESLRLRTMLVADEYKNLRSATLQTTQAAHVFSPEVGRMSAALGALKSGAVGAGAGLRRGLSSALGLVGGPWGAAFLAGTAVLTTFWQEQKKAKAFVDQLTSSLDEQTGALTKQGRADVIGKLYDEKVLTRAKAFGLNVEAVTKAALGSAPAIAQVRAELDKYVASFAGDRTVQLKAGEAAEDLFGKITGTTGALADAREKWNLLAEAQGKGEKTTKDVASATQTYATSLSEAKDKVQQLLAKENERRNANLKSRRDEIGLQQAIFDARREAFDGAKGLDISTEEGRANKSALLDLADQWNNTADAVKNTKGAQMEVRVAFLQTAIQMGATKGEAKKLADQLLDIPKNKAIDITTPGMQQALADAAKLKTDLEAARLSARNIAIAQGAKNRDELSDIHRARGGPIFGPGTGTSDSILMWGSNGEFMQRKAAVDYYGMDFMRRLNNLQVPKFGGGGSVGGGTSTVTHGPGVNIENQTVVAHNYGDFLQQQQNLTRMSASDGIQR